MRSYRHAFPRLRGPRFLVMVALSAGALLGCGPATTSTETQSQRPSPDAMAGSDADPADAGTLPPAAHSLSFFPVQGVLANGQPAGELYWDYRLDHGQPYASNSNPGLVFQYQDETQTIRGAALVQTTEAAVSGNASGTSSAVITEQIDTATSGVLSVSSDSMATLDTGRPTSAWRRRLPCRCRGSSIARISTRCPSGTPRARALPSRRRSRARSRSTAEADQAFGTGSFMSSWNLLGKLATYTVLGVTYTDVVNVQATAIGTVQMTDSTGQSSTATTTTTTLAWLTRGVGIVYSETTTQQQSGSDTTTAEL